MKNLLFLFVCTFLFTLSVKSQNLEWVTQGKSPGKVYYEHLSQSQEGFIYAFGAFDDTLDLYSTEGELIESAYSDGSRDLFLTKSDTAGNLIWSKRLGGSGMELPDQMHMDASGNLYLLGTFNQAMDFDPGPGEYLLTPDNSNDFFILKLTEEAEFIWVRHFESPGYMHAHDVFTNDDNELFVVGRVSTTGGVETVDLDPGEGEHIVTTSAGFINGFLIKLDPEGELFFARSWVNDAYINFRGIRTFANGDIILCSSFVGEIDFDPGVGEDWISSLGVPNALNHDLALTKLDSQGDYIWTKLIAGQERDLCSGIEVDENDRLFVIGSFKSSCDFDPSEDELILNSTSEKDPFVAKYDSSANLIWIETIKSTGDAPVNFDIVVDIAFSKSGNIYVVGKVSGDISYSTESDTLAGSTQGSFDMFIGKMNPSGTWSWIEHFGSDDFDNVQAVVVDDNEDIYFIGEHFSDLTIEVNGTTVFCPVQGVQSTIMAKFSQCADTYVHENGSSLTSNAEDATYQWIDCETDEPIEGADGQTFSPHFVGSYAVVVTQRGCTDTSMCHDIDEVGFGGFGSSLILIYPNPASAQLVVESEVDGYIQMYNSIGELLIEQNVYAGVNHINVSRFPVAHYIVRFFSDSGTESKKFVIER